MEDEAAAALRALAASASNKTKMARLRELYSDIEAARTAGVRQQKIVESLNAHGLDVTYEQLRTMMSRIKKELQKGKEKVALVPPRAAIPLSFAPRAKVSSDATVLPQGSNTGADDGAEQDGLSDKQRREKKADQYINAASNNPLLKHLKIHKP